MAISALLLSDLRAYTLPLKRVATRLHLTSSPFVALLVFLTVLFVVSVRNTWGNLGLLVYFVSSYVLLLAYAISFKCVMHLPRGSAAWAWSRRIHFFSLAGVIAAMWYRCEYLS